MDQAIGPPPVRQRRLHRIGIGRHRLADDVVQLNFPEGAACLLVRQNVLQGQDVTRQLFDIRLRLVDRLKPLLKIAQRPGGARRRPLKAFGHALGHFRQPLLHQVQDLGLRHRLRLGHMGQATGKLLLPVRQGLHPLAKLAEVIGQWFGHAGRPRGGAHGQDDKNEKRQDQRRAAEDGKHQRVAQRIALSVDRDHVRPKSRSMSDSFSST